MSFLTTQGFWQPIMKNLLLYMVIISLTAGLFEETARLICAKLLKQHRTFQDSLSYGLGHGICEVVLLTGIAHAGNLALCFFLRSNDTQAISSLLSGGELEALASQLEALTPVSIYLGVLERISAVMFHIFATTLIFQGVNRKKPFTYWLYAVTAHMLFNFVGVVLAQYAGLYASEGAMFLLALAGIYYVWKEKNSFPVPEKEAPVKKHFPV